MNRPKAIGTAAESAVVRVLRTAGFMHAERRALRGVLDAGDIAGCLGCCFSVKGGAAAKTASDNLIASWLDECMTQTARARADVGVLVVARAGIGEANAGRWWAVMRGAQYANLCHPLAPILVTPRHDGPIRMHLSQACALLVYAGYGSVPATEGVPA